MTPTERHGQGYGTKGQKWPHICDILRKPKWRAKTHRSRETCQSKAIFKLLVLTQNVELKPQHPVRAQKRWPKNILKYCLIYLTQNWPYWIYFFLNKVHFLIYLCEEDTKGSEVTIKEGSFLPLHGFWAWNSGCQAWQEMPSQMSHRTDLKNTS